MTLDHCANILMLLARSGQAGALLEMDTSMTDYAVENRHMYANSADLWDALSIQFRDKTRDLPPGLVNQMLEKIAEHIPLGQ